MSACTFFGHRLMPNKVYHHIISSVEALICDHGVDTFYVGNNGEFDRTVRRALKDLKEVYPEIKYYVVLAYMPRNDGEDYSDSIYPEGLENVPKRFAISWRNEWMIKQSDYVIGYVDHPFGGAHNFFEKAKKKEKKVINIAEFYK
ncbi:MAG: DUF1273 domain-containing protein [Ruminococcaceae bacterium]|nr:DUF1273 domain-containing protein [Oscillospiraceae bacterium]MBQ7119907.1 hypothetical protein [Oscillospiraceae bacterium]